jgi:hypothetical protein
MYQKTRCLIVSAILVCLAACVVQAQSTEFTYQGRLLRAGVPADGNYDFEFTVFDGVLGGVPVAPPLLLTNVLVTNGVFSVRLNFGNVFPGASRFLEIKVRDAGGETFSTLTPRQAVSSSPYAIRSLNSTNANVATSAINATNATNAANATNATIAVTATNALNLGGVAANQFVLTGDARLADARSPLPGSASYIQNTATLQANSQFNISGNGTVGGTLSGNVVSATAQFNIGANRILIGGTNNLMAGVNAGPNNSGDNNAFFGFEAGNSNTTGFENTFVGDSAGQFTTTGDYNTFVGKDAGRFNTTGTSNTALGRHADFTVNNLVFATAIGAHADVSTNDTIVLGKVAGTYLGAARPADTVLVRGLLQVPTLGSAGGTALCRNGSNQISTCSSSIRYKTDLAAYNPGLNLIKRLRPVSFTWKTDHLFDFGLVAEEVAEVEPLLTFKNDKGEIEGVKYDRVGVVLINAVQEQQRLIETQQKAIDGQKQQNLSLRKQVEAQQVKLDRQQSELNALKRLVCAQNSTAEFCQSRN